jgi:two-component system sensor histidine kinase/response regulator
MSTEVSAPGEIGPNLAAAVAPEAAAPATIMIVEDDDDLVNLLEYRLRKEGFDTVIARDGIEACRLFAVVEIDLILLDILMPGMDGWEVCRRLRGHQDPRLAKLPVIMLTALSTGENRIKGLECGADLYLAKPYSVREVVLNCRRLIAERQERLRLQSELESLKGKEQGGSDAQRMLFHELRSQFTVIGGLCGRMLNSDDPQHLSELARDRGYLEVIRTSVKQVSDMADEVLLLSKLRSADLCLPRVDCRLDEIVAEVLAISCAKAQMKGVVMSVSALPPHPVRSHRLALKIILSSLLENAVKYCPQGSVVTLRVTVADTVVRLEVEDQGPGIPAEEQEKIFEPYYRGETVRDSHQGSGLGLYSVKRLTEALGGTVTLTSAPGAGSLFTVMFKGPDNC